MSVYRSPNCTEHLNAKPWLVMGGIALGTALMCCGLYAFCASRSNKYVVSILAVQ